MRPTRAFVLGHAGMLGHVVALRARERGWTVLTSTERYRHVGALDVGLVQQVRTSGAAVIINCLGRTRQETNDPMELRIPNGLFPIHLGGRMLPEQYLIHASTDCVFAPTGSRRVTDKQDATDEYGVSKTIGEVVAECPNATVIRVSVVGPSPTNGRGLLEWFLGFPADTPVPGWTDHFWNGITTLDWAECALDLADARQRGDPVPSICQPGTGAVSKYELLCAFRDVWRPTCTVEPLVSGVRVDRTLVPTDVRAPIPRQLRRLAGWYPRGRDG